MSAKPGPLTDYELAQIVRKGRAVPYMTAVRLVEQIRAKDGPARNTPGQDEAAAAIAKAESEAAAKAKAAAAASKAAQAKEAPPPKPAEKPPEEPPEEPKDKGPVKSEAVRRARVRSAPGPAKG